MWLGRTTLTAAVLLVVLAGAGAASAVVVTFDSLPVGSKYYWDDTFSDGGATFTVPNPGIPYDNIAFSAQVVDSNYAGGGGNELLLDRVGITFSPTPVMGLSFQYANRSAVGGAGLTINGSYYEATSPIDFIDLHGMTIGGVQVFVTPSTTDYGYKGAVFLIGRIDSLGISGDRLYIDNIIASVVPEPATLGLLAAGGLLAAHRGRRVA